MEKINMYGLELDPTPCLVMESEVGVNSSVVHTVFDVVELMNHVLRLYKKAEEHVYALFLSNRCKIIWISEVSHGSANQATMNPREILMRALLTGAVSLIVVHNHPSGDITPSKEDIKATKKLSDASKLIGITLLDSVIVGSEGTYYSFLNAGMNGSDA